MRQLVGLTCPLCQTRISSVADGAFCPKCASPVHTKCVRTSVGPGACPTCGTPDTSLTAEREKYDEQASALAAPRSSETKLRLVLIPLIVIGFLTLGFSVFRVTDYFQESAHPRPSSPQGPNRTTPEKSLDDWQVVTTEDRVATAEMPGTPERRTERTETAEGVLERHRLRLSLAEKNMFFSLMDFNLLDPALSDEERFNGVKNTVPGLLKATLLSNRKTTVDGVSGIDLEVETDQLWGRVRFFIRRNRGYQTTVLVDKKDKNSEAVNRFVDSLAFSKDEK